MGWWKGWKAARWAGVVGLAAAVFGISVGCPRGKAEEDPPESTDGFDRNALLRSEAEQVILPTYRELSTRADALKVATAASLAAVGGPGAATALEAARAAWREAITPTQVAELFQIGPAGLGSVVTGGQDLRAPIYSWPTVSPCRVDQVLAEEQYAKAGFFDSALVNAVGLASIEYLLFHDGPDNACASTAAPNTGGKWAGIAAPELARRRAAYAAAAAARVADNARALVTAWEPSGGNFAGKLAAAGTSSSVYSTAQSAVNELFVAIFYIDLLTKDKKLAIPAGISPSCAAASCPDQAESRWAKHSGQNIVANLRALRAVIRGNLEGQPVGVGFDDFLAARGAQPLAEEIDAELVAAISAAEGLNGDFETLLVTAPAQVKPVYDAVKKVTDTLKSQLVTVLNLMISGEGPSDND